MFLNWWLRPGTLGSFHSHSHLLFCQDSEALWGCSERNVSCKAQAFPSALRGHHFLLRSLQTQGRLCMWPSIRDSILLLTVASPLCSPYLCPVLQSLDTFSHWVFDVQQISKWGEHNSLRTSENSWAYHVPELLSLQRRVSTGLLDGCFKGCQTDPVVGIHIPTSTIHHKHQPR